MIVNVYIVDVNDYVFYILYFILINSLVVIEMVFRIVFVGYLVIKVIVMDLDFG